MRALLYITFTLVFIYLTITAWDELFDYLIKKAFNIKEETLSYHLLKVVIVTLILIIFFFILDEDVRTFLGIELI